ncbi:tRNA pseudouridine(55) synthase TruB [Candidatus Saccharibacteria bacterium]|jgi:tRNA pseudouridine55 synthase|nr:tRNA pseudouridine(55) synthase TruB [Candidatus Saccharibacteria bacterium]
MNDILLVDKPVGWTSFDVVAKIRGQIKHAYLAKGEKPTKRQLKVGHAGTLDPFATGLLIILLGDATKRADEFLKLDKVYEATITLGSTSTTGDPEGEITEVSKTIPTRDDIEKALAQFRGEITQRPPIFSAIKINGQRAYKLARDGKAVEVPERTVLIHSLELVEYSYPELKIRTHVGSGTYIRSLAVDIGEALKTGAYCSQLRRIRIAEWDVASAVKVLDTIATER